MVWLRNCNTPLSFTQSRTSRSFTRVQIKDMEVSMSGHDLFNIHNSFSLLNESLQPFLATNFPPLQSRQIAYLLMVMLLLLTRLLQMFWFLPLCNLYANICFSSLTSSIYMPRKVCLFPQETNKSPKRFYVIYISPLITYLLACVTLFYSAYHWMVHCFPLIFLFAVHFYRDSIHNLPFP